ncbi:unnamed protein product [Brugia timori]|uniref:Uncharacterized protein n=1 Tax=Brugia timori TaxID=42155 RepID=A0A0R3R680_9BILA|nr:unnamed protein product [Brugia timori]
MITPRFLILNLLHLNKDIFHENLSKQTSETDKQNSRYNSINLCINFC